MRSIIKHIKSGRFNRFILFFVFSFWILIVTKLSQTLEKTIYVKIKPVGVPEEKLILEEGMSRTIPVLVKTSGFKLSRLYLTEVVFELDLSIIEPDGNTYSWQPSAYIPQIEQSLGNGVEVLFVQEKQLLLKFDELSTKKVPVDLNIEINFEKGFNTTEGIKVLPDSIRIVGPETAIAPIKNIGTALLRLKNINRDIDEEISLNLANKTDAIKYSAQKVSVYATVEKFTEGSQSIPVNIINVPRGKNIKVFPSEVMVKYATSLSHFKAIGKNDFIVECDFGEIDSTDTFLVPKLIKQPQHLKNVRLVQNRIDFIISE